MTLQQQQVTACLWTVAKSLGVLGLIQLNKQNTLPIWLFHISSTVVQSTSFLFPKKRFLLFIFFFFFFIPLSVLAPSRRGDLEILGYCMLQWLCGKLPWEQNLKDPVAVQTAKTK